MKVVLSEVAMVAIIAAVIVGGIFAGLFHDASIKGVYASFDGQVADLQSQNANLRSQVNQLQAPKFTLVHGTVSISHTPITIFFDGQDGQSLSAAVTLSNSYSYTYQYQVYLRTGVNYGVRINYDGGVFSSPGSCAGIPVVVVPSGLDYAKNFSC
jgi:hypothetical protein